ncbi:MAG: hypothetical protein IJI47_05915 [Eubacterium sp.]|nr:hypothetical protein [Eubacterium sp.]
MVSGKNQRKAKPCNELHFVRELHLAVREMPFRRELPSALKAIQFIHLYNTNQKAAFGEILI